MFFTRNQSAALPSARTGSYHPGPARCAAGSCVVSNGYSPSQRSVVATRKGASRFAASAIRIFRSRGDGQQRERLIEVRVGKILSQLERLGIARSGLVVAAPAGIRSRWRHKYKAARILAVDLSLSSLCYAKRKTPAGATKIEYAQAFGRNGGFGPAFNCFDGSGAGRIYGDGSVNGHHPVPQ